jgi:putative ABC transport system permease protein
VEAVLQRLRAGAADVPGVRSAALVSGMPPVRPVNANDFQVIGRPHVEGEAPWNVDYWQVVSEDALEVLGARLVSGRTIDKRDVATSQSIVLVNEAFAKRFFPGEDPIGKRVSLTNDWPGRPPSEQTIVGVVRDVKNRGVDASAGTEVFVPIHQSPQMGFAQRSVNLVVRTEGDPRAHFGAMRAFIASVDPNLPVAYLRTMDQVVYESIAKPRFVTTLLAVFAGIALLMAAIGIYGVMSYTVERRTHELGIRMAIGADAGKLKAMLVKQGLALAAAGVGVGLCAALGVTALLGRWLAQLLFAVESVDPATYAVVAPATLAIAALACWVPARRATQIHPMTALRHE